MNPSQTLTEYGQAVRAKRSAEHVVWILGAGFSQPLGGPLFGDLFGPETDRWVTAWMKWRLGDTGGTTNACQIFDEGREAGLWQDAESCLAMLDEACTDDLTRRVVKDGLRLDDPEEVKSIRTQLTQFVAVATSHFVDRVCSKAAFPEAWDPYVSWWSSLVENDFVLSLNYDRVVEVVMARNPKAVTLKLHGSVPEELKDCIQHGREITEIGMPGPSKARVSRDQFEHVWAQGAECLRHADRVVVIGYSFPRTDSRVRTFVLENIVRSSDVANLDIVVGNDEAGREIEAMFRRLLPKAEIRNTGLLAQQYLVEGTVSQPHGRFNHWGD